MQRLNRCIGVKIGLFHMSVSPQTNAEQPVVQEQKQSDKEYNFAQIRKQLEQERAARQQAENDKLQLMEQINRVATQKSAHDDDDSGDEPYVDEKRLNKKLAKFEAALSEKFEQKAEEKAHQKLEEFKKQQWMKSNPDFNEVMDHAQKFADRDPELAESILSMPDNFERVKLVYKNIKALGLHKKEETKSAIQDKINQNQRSPFYQPSGTSGPGYAAMGDFSDAGQKNSYNKMQELKNRLRLG